MNAADEIVLAAFGVQSSVLRASPGLGAWLYQTGGSLAFTAGQSPHLCFLFADEQGTLGLQEGINESTTGFAAGGETLWISSGEQVWRFADVGPKTIGGIAADAVYMPRKGHVIGPCKARDLLADVTFRGRWYEVLFVNAAFGCIATVDDCQNFQPVWKPSFVSARPPGHLCPLYGMAARDGDLAFVTLSGPDDGPRGVAAAQRRDGMVLDVYSSNVLCSGLSLPHSPCWHDGRLWLLNSGVGDFGYLDHGHFVPVALCPGFARGLCFAGDMAVIGVSPSREDSAVSGLLVNDRQQTQEPGRFCGLLAVDPATGATRHWLSIGGQQAELYDLAFLPGVRRPYSSGFCHPGLHHTPLTVPEDDVFPAAWSDLRPRSAKEASP